MIDEHAATERKWEDDNDLRCHFDVLINIYTRVGISIGIFFPSLIESKKMKNWMCVCSASLKDHFSFCLFSTVDRQADAQKHTSTPCSILQSIDLKSHMFWKRKETMNILQFSFAFNLTQRHVCDLSSSYWWWWVNTENKIRNLSIGSVTLEIK